MVRDVDLLRFYHLSQHSRVAVVRIATANVGVEVPHQHVVCARIRDRFAERCIEGVSGSLGRTFHRGVSADDVDLDPPPPRGEYSDTGAEVSDCNQFGGVWSVAEREAYAEHGLFLFVLVGGPQNAGTEAP